MNIRLMASVSPYMPLNMCICVSMLVGTTRNMTGIVMVMGIIMPMGDFIIIDFVIV